jgi:hypothetical protein
MRFLTDISHFENTNDYLPILVGILNAELIFLALLFYNAIRSPVIKGWYHRFHLSAILLDCLILFIGIILARFFYSFFFSTWNLFFFILLTIVIQMIHDYIFYLFVKSVPLGSNQIFDYMKKYTKRVGVYAIVGDSILIALACFLSSHFAVYNENIQIILLIFSLYNIPYMIYMK